jgi:hypothetical protein
MHNRAEQRKGWQNSTQERQQQSYRMHIQAAVTCVWSPCHANTTVTETQTKAKNKANKTRQTEQTRKRRQDKQTSDSAEQHRPTAYSSSTAAVTNTTITSVLAANHCSQSRQHAPAAHSNVHQQTSVSIIAAAA